MIDFMASTVRTATAATGDHQELNVWLGPVGNAISNFILLQLI